MTYLHLLYSELLHLVSCSKEQLSKCNYGTVKNDQNVKNVGVKPFSEQKNMSFRYGQKRPKFKESHSGAIEALFSSTIFKGNEAEMSFQYGI